MSSSISSIIAIDQMFSRIDKGLADFSVMCVAVTQLCLVMQKQS